VFIGKIVLKMGKFTQTHLISEDNYGTTEPFPSSTWG